MAEKWNSKVQFPTDNFKIRCIDESFGPSNSSSKPMITLEFEVVSPELVTVAGQEYGVGGVKIKHYAVTKSVDEAGVEDASKSETIKKRLDELTMKFGLPAITDVENPELGFKGKVVWALLKSEIAEKRKAPTAEQLAKGIKQGEIITNPIDGKPLINYWPRIDEIFGLAPE